MEENSPHTQNGRDHLDIKPLGALGENDEEEEEGNQRTGEDVNNDSGKIEKN